MVNILFLAFVCAIQGALSAHFAQRRGRDPLIWFFLGILFGLIALIVLFYLPPATAEKPVGPVETSGSFSDAKMDAATSWANSLPADDEEEQAILAPEDIPIAQRDWFYLDTNRQQQGPVPLADLLQALKQGELNAESYLWSEGMDDWKRAKEIEGMSEALSLN